MGEKMNLFKIAYKVCRKSSKDIYKGFGFRHLSDATQYYVHPFNQSIQGKTTLCQPIGESVICFTNMLSSITNWEEGSEKLGNYWVSADKTEFLLEMKMPQDYRDNQVVEDEIYSYKALLRGENITICAYDIDGNILESNMEHLSTRYKLLPIFCTCIAREMEKSNSYREIIEKFIASPNPEDFVNLNEDLYQMHKMDEFNVQYSENMEFNKASADSFAESYETIIENKQSLKVINDFKITPFKDEEFSVEQRRYIPKLSSEFILPAKLNSLCNAIKSGDILTTLFHGPAGTGKTISCKLVCQSIKLPILETINCTENLDEFVLGKFIPQDDKIVFKESFVTKAIRDGGAVVFEEINFAKPQYLAFLNSLLDDNGFVRLDNGDVVKRHKNFRFFATMNLGYFGTKELNQALYNRFNSIIEISALSDESIQLMLETRVPECKGFSKKIISVYHKIQKKIEAEELDVVISPRNLENWARLAKYEGYMTAAEKTIIPIAKCDRILEQTIRGILMLYKWT